MTALEQQYVVMLEKVLDNDFIPHLPPLLNKTKSPDDQLKKNRSRAFSAFALHNICDISKTDAAIAVVDDFEDQGVDAIYYHAPAETLYLVQSKLKASQQFSQDEALAFCQGVRNLIKQDFSGFNENVNKRAVEIEGALDNCSHIKLVVAHTGSGISEHAKQALHELLNDESHGEERLVPQVVDYDSARIIADLRAAQAYERIDTELAVHKCAMVAEPRVTYFGLVRLEELVKLHGKHGKALYERNIRTFLGHNEVNSAIQQTLATNPKDFLYFNNGVTALCQIIDPKSNKGGTKRLRIHGFSVINGAQTIASSAKFLQDNSGADISAARVSVTLIKSDGDVKFSKLVTQARNHQNPVKFSNFAALDEEQERLRRDLAYLGIQYVYKAEAADNTGDPKRIEIDDAALALAIFQPDPRFVVWLKKESANLLDTTSAQYKALFGQGVTAFYLANAVAFVRYALQRAAAEASHALGIQRLAYKHGNYAIAWILSKRVSAAASSTVLFDPAKLKADLSAPFDQLRQAHWEATKVRTAQKGPLALFRSQQDTVPLLQEVAIANYGLSSDPVIEHKKKQQKIGQPYPEDLFAYLVSKAPQIGNLA